MISTYSIFLWILYIFPTFGCMPDGIHNKVTLGKSTYVCVTIGPLNWASKKYTSYLKMSTTPTADELSRITIHNSWSDTNYSTDSLINKLGYMNESRESGVAISVESMGVISYQKAYRYRGTDNVGITYPLMMAIINVDKGKVKEIVWDDDGCSFCDATSCGPNVYDFEGKLQGSLGSTCWVRDTSCHILNRGYYNSTLQTSELCELSVYVVWTGSDSNGIYFSSASAKFSLYSKAQVTTITDDLQDDHVNVKNTVASKDPTPTKMPTRTPTLTPSSPTVNPSVSPSAPTATPSFAPSIPTSSPSSTPSSAPSADPTSPSNSPVISPSFNPSIVPSLAPSSPPSELPSSLPSLHHPSAVPSPLPTSLPTDQPVV